MGFSPERNSCSHGHSFWEVVNSGQEMSWHFGLGVVTLLSLSGHGELDQDFKSRKGLGHSGCGD